MARLLWEQVDGVACDFAFTSVSGGDATFANPLNEYRLAKRVRRPRIYFITVARTFSTVWAGTSELHCAGISPIALGVVNLRFSGVRGGRIPSLRVEIFGLGGWVYKILRRGNSENRDIHPFRVK